MLMCLHPVTQLLNIHTSSHTNTQVNSSSIRAFRQSINAYILPFVQIDIQTLELHMMKQV